MGESLNAVFMKGNTKMKKISYLICCVLSLFVMASCNAIDDERIPAQAVNIKLDNTGLWNTYGVAGFGQYRYFIRDNREPSNFPFTQTTYTGFGGVLLIGGMDPFTSETNVPLAYDLACPVECKKDVRVFIDDETLDAVCPQCMSHYNVLTGGGSPLSGPALTGSVKYRLQPYQCVPSVNGGYTITR